MTEELEKLEQSITLTLQEIDHNFSKAHRIVTTNILPLVEQYGEHSKNVWEASKVRRLSGRESGEFLLGILLLKHALGSSGSSSSRPRPTFRYRATRS